jgi:hypothetical protein
MSDRRNKELAPTRNITFDRTTNDPMAEQNNALSPRVWMMSLDGAALACRAPTRAPHRNGDDRGNSD